MRCPQGIHPTYMPAPECAVRPVVHTLSHRRRCHTLRHIHHHHRSFADSSDGTRQAHPDTARYHRRNCRLRIRRTDHRSRRTRIQPFRNQIQLSASVPPPLGGKASKGGSSAASSPSFTMRMSGRSIGPSLGVITSGTASGSSCDSPVVGNTGGEVRQCPNRPLARRRGGKTR